MLRLIASALFVCLLSTASFAQGASGPVILPSGCGTANYTYGVGYLTIDPQGHLCGSVTSTPAAPTAGTAGAGFPTGATPVTASATGTTAGATATLAAAAGKFTYICGFSVSPGSASAAITISVTATGIANTFTESVGAPLTAAGTTGLSFSRTFTPCVPGSAVNAAIAVAAGALGTGGVGQSVYAWGYQQ